MKHLFYKLTLFFTAFTVFSSGIYAKNPSVVGKIVYLKGSVNIIDLKEKKNRRAKLNETIQRFDEIRSGAGSDIDVLMINGTKIHIYPRSVLNIYQKKRKGKLKTTLRLLIGQIRISIHVKLKKSESFYVKTPSTVAGVRGTDFGVITSLKETRVVVFTGIVEVANRNKLLKQSYILQPKSEIKVLINREPAPPRILPDDFLNTWFQSYYINVDGDIARKIREKDTLFDYFLKDRSN